MSMQAGWFAWGRFFKPRDGLGRESRTLFFVSITIILIWVGMVACVIQFINHPDKITINDFALSFVTLGGVLSTVLGIWLGREWLKQTKVTSSGDL